MNDNNNQQHSIVLDGVSKSFDRVCALNDISISFDHQKSTAIVGPSGCGKSTLLKMVNGLLKPNHGNVYIDGSNIDECDLESVRRRLGYCVQHIGLFPHMTVRDNIALLAILEHWDDQRIEQRLHSLLSLVALDIDLLARYPFQLSGGQQQRAGLCRALMLNPDFLLLDEAFGAVDPITRIDIHEQFQQLQKLEKRTTLLVTHDIREALALSDYIVVMRNGEIIEHQPTEYYRNHADAEQLILDRIRHAHV